MSFLLNPQDPHFWTSIALIVFLAALWFAKVPAMLTWTLDEAGAKVQAQLDEAKRLREEAQAMLAGIHAQRIETEKAAAEMLKTAQADADRLRAEAAVKLEDDVKRRGLVAERKIALAESRAAGEVKAAAADLAAQAAEAILTARIAGSATDPLIDAGLSRLATRFG